MKMTENMRKLYRDACATFYVLPSFETQLLADIIWVCVLFKELAKMPLSLFYSQ